MSKVDNVHQSDQVAGTVLSKEFCADKQIYCANECGKNKNEDLLLYYYNYI